MWNAILTHTPLLYLVQSFWRDEAFSVLAAEQPLRFIVSRLGFEPPVYYTLLHFWVKIFGDSEIAARSLSLVGFVLATCLMVEWGALLFKKHWLALFLPLFFFLNPMLLYYAFEVRTYAWYTLFATLALFSYANKKWRWFIVTATLAFYTHTYFLPFLAALGIHWIVSDLWGKRLRIATLMKSMQLRAFLAIGVLMSPWLIRVLQQTARLKSSWYYPVNWQLVQSVLGNMFTGYEGTPWYGWAYTRILSVIILVFLGGMLLDKTHRKRNLLIGLFTIIPLGITVGISFVKPLFVNRYLIPVTVGEVLGITLAIAAIRNSLIQKAIAALLLIGVLWVNWWFPPQHPKLPIRDTFEQVNMLMKDNDTVLAADPLIYLETKYYTKDRRRAFFYNPQNGAFPWYVGDALVTPADIVRDFPLYPDRGFLIHADGSFEIVYRTSVNGLKTQSKRK